MSEKNTNIPNSKLKWLLGASIIAALSVPYIVINPSNNNLDKTAPTTTETTPPPKSQVQVFPTDRLNLERFVE